MLVEVQNRSCASVIWIKETQNDNLLVVQYWKKAKTFIIGTEESGLIIQVAPESIGRLVLLKNQAHGGESVLSLEINEKNSLVVSGGRDSRVVLTNCHNGETQSVYEKFRTGSGRSVGLHLARRRPLGFPTMS